MKKWLSGVFVLGIVLMLAACSSNSKDEIDDTTTQEENANSVGFEASDTQIEEATNIPKNEKENIIAAFNEYLDSFNAEDIERYKQILSKNAQGFNYDEEIQWTENTFKKNDIVRTASDITIVKYSDQEAQVYANIATDMKEVGTDAQLNYSGRQVTVFVKEDDNWKVSSVFYIENKSQ